MSINAPAGLRFAAAISTESDTDRALEDVCARAAAQLGAPADLAMLFVSQHHGPDFARIAAAVCDSVGTERLLGCTGEAIVGESREIENGPAIALWLASLPGVSLSTMHLRFERTSDGGTFVGWPDGLGDNWPKDSCLLLLGEPFSFPADVLLSRLNDDQPGVPVLGGMASGGWEPGQNRILFGREALAEGAVAVLIHGAVRVRRVVSQGCRPVGRPLVVTKAERNVIRELSGKPALAQFREIWQDLSPAEQALVQSGLHVGLVINEYQERFGRGDFLVRNVVGADPESGAMAVGDYPRVGQTVQFHLRDAAAADEDLGELLSAAKAESKIAAAGALLFTCNGRGTRLFPEPHHDARLVARALGDVPTAGFFAQGEIGPVGGKNFLHGFTASVAIFEPVE